MRQSLARDPQSADPAALVAVCIHRDLRHRPGHYDVDLDAVRSWLPKGAGVVDRSGLDPCDALTGTAESVRLVDAVIMIGTRPADRYSTPGDARIDLDPAQRAIVELARARGVDVCIGSREGTLYRLEDCHRTDRRGGMRLVQPASDGDSAVPGCTATPRG